MNNPRHVQVNPKNATPAKIEHQLMPLRHRNKLELIVQVAKNLNPFLAIIFTNTKEEADEVADEMLARDMNVERLHGGLAPRERKRVMRLLEEAKIQYLVATDLAARGIDIKGISHIINYSLPKDLNFYIHRVGRSARAGEDGVAVTLFSDEDHQAIEKLMKQNIQFIFVDLKNDEWITIERPLVKRKTSRKKAPKEVENIYVPLSKKVKPGYKKKQQLEKEKIAKRLRKLQYKRSRNKR